MKRAKSPYLNDSKTSECITRFQLIPPNLVLKDNPLFSAFSRTKLKKNISHELHQIRCNKTDNLINQIKFKQNPSKKSLLLGRGQANHSILQGVLRARKSHMKKLKLKQFYLEEYCQDSNQHIDRNIQCVFDNKVIQSKNSTEFNTIQSKQISTGSNNLPFTQKRKILPVKLRARSYSNISRTVKDRTNDSTNDQNSFLIKPKKNMSFHLIQKNKSNEYEMNQSSFQNHPRRILRSGDKKKYQKQQNQRSILGDASLKLNETNEAPKNILCQNNAQTNKNYQSLKNRKSKNYSKAHQSIFQINGWWNNHNQEDKQNQFFIF